MGSPTQGEKAHSQPANAGALGLYWCQRGRASVQVASPRLNPRSGMGAAAPTERAFGRREDTGDERISQESAALCFDQLVERFPFGDRLALYF